MAQRKKSYDDIIEQTQRMYATDRSLNGGHWDSPRIRKIEGISRRYVQNIFKNRGVPTADGKFKTIETTKKYSRSAYMGGNNG